MGALPESTLNLLLSGAMGVIGGLVTMPLNTFIMWKLKRSEQLYQHKLDVIAQERALFFQHRLEMQSKKLGCQGCVEIARLQEAIKQIEQRL